MYTGIRWGNLKGKKPLGKPRRRWESNIEMGLQETDRMGAWNGLILLSIGTR